MNTTAVFLTMLLLTASAAPASAQYWWPMFRYEKARWGYSRSTAPSQGALSWSFTTGIDVHSSPAVVDGRVYVGSRDGRVYCLEAEGNGDGSTNVIWSYDIGGDVSCSPAVVGGRVYVGNGFNKFFCLSTDGNEIWQHLCDGGIESSPAVYLDRVCFGTDQGTLYCLDRVGNGDGTTNAIWTLSLANSSIRSSPAVANNKVYFGLESSSGHRMYCVDLMGNGDGTTTIYWKRNFSRSVYSSPVCVNWGAGYEPRVFIAEGIPGQSSGKIYCLDASEIAGQGGSVIWEYEIGGASGTSPALAGWGYVYIASHNQNVYCLDAAGNGDGTTNLIWSYDTGSSLDYSSVAAADGKVFIGSTDYKLYCLDAMGNGDGTTDVLWTHKTDGVITSSPAIADGKVYIGSHDGKVYCFEQDSGQSVPALPAWGVVAMALLLMLVGLVAHVWRSRVLSGKEA